MQKELRIDIFSIKELEAFSARDKRWKDVKAFLDPTRLAKFSKAKAGTSNRYFQAGAGLLLSLSALTEKEKQKQAQKKEKVSAEDVKVTVKTWSYDKLIEALCNLSATTDFDVQTLSYREGEKGKPYWEDSSLPYFSLSHSGDYVVLVSAPSEVGVDLQQHRDISKTAVSGRHFAKTEADYLASKDSEPTDFFILWTRKEALGKCEGVGLIPMLERDFLDLDAEEYKPYYWMEIDGLTGYSMAICMKL